MPVGLVAGGRSTGSSRPLSAHLELDELPGRLIGAGLRRREQLDDLRGMQHAPPAGRDDAPRSLVERSKRLARRVADLDRDIVAGRREEVQDPVAQRPIFPTQSTLDGDQFDSEPRP